MEQETEKQKPVGKRRRRMKQKMAWILVVFFTLVSCLSFSLPGSYAQTAEFSIELPLKGSMMADYDFTFFQRRLGTGIFYWRKSDGTPMFCVQKDKALVGGLTGSETAEEFGDEIYFTKKQYELVSLVLQSCGLRRGQEGDLLPGEYLAGQAAVWGIQTGNWEDTQKLCREMEVLYEHVGDWNQWTAQELVDQARPMIQQICQDIDAYYGDNSPYVPAFASKYEDQAPVWEAEWQEDGSCRAVFSLGDRDEAVKEFRFFLPEGWSWGWDGDEIIFSAQDPEPGQILVSGRAPEGTALGDAMPIGLIYIVSPSNYPTFQHLASGVEITLPWSCYFSLMVPEKPEDPGTWELPQVSCYRHQEIFEVDYGVEIKKQDGETGQPLSGGVFQILEAFDDRQLEGTVLDPRQIQGWEGWREHCPQEITDEEGRIVHRDKKTYQYEKTYCGGHPEPKITYEGSSQEQLETLEAEAWEAWRQAVEECENTCDFHRIDGRGEEALKADRDLAFQQFAGLKYGYAFQEVQAPKGYLLPEDQELEPVLVSSLQGEGEKEESLERSLQTRTFVQAASSSSARRRQASPSQAVMEQKASSSQILKKSTRSPRLLTWLTSQLPPLSPESADDSSLHVFLVDNYQEPPKETPPKETPPEETPPEETPPEETPPEETPPEETLPEDTPPEETSPEEPSHSHSGGGGDRERERTEETVPSQAVQTEESPSVSTGWITVTYQRQRSAGQEKGEQEEIGTPDGKINLPQTGDQGMMARFLGITAVIAVLGIIVLVLLRRKSGGKGGQLMVLCIVLTGMLFGGAGKTYGASPSEAGRKHWAEDDSLIRYFPYDEEQGDAFVPEKEYTDEAGRNYQLDFYRQVEILIPQTSEKEQKLYEFTGIEEENQIPKFISVEKEDEENGRKGQGRLWQEELQRVSSRWSSDFSLDLVFHDYGSEQYALGELILPGDLDVLLNYEEEILAAAGLSPDRYHIQEITWNGESYLEEGVSCRRAKAAGEKLVEDYQGEFAGEIDYPETLRRQWQAVYQLQGETADETTVSEKESLSHQVVIPETSQEETAAQDPPSSPWILRKVLIIYSAALIFLIPAFFLLILWRRKRKKTS